MRNIKNMVAGGKLCFFVSTWNGSLRYRTECGYHFVIPAEEAVDAVFHAEERAIHLMRWINRALKADEEAT